MDQKFGEEVVIYVDETVAVATTAIVPDAAIDFPVVQLPPESKPD